MIKPNPGNPELRSSIEFDVGFTATSILHPATYLNKVLVASSEGSMQLWNIRNQLVARLSLYYIC
jgi:U3 small nucleolar RNA-associated protein 21